LAVIAAKFILVAIAAGGCSRSSTPPAPYFHKAQLMAGFYGHYLVEHNTKAPPDEAAFRKYLETKPDDLLQANLTVDEMFRSPRNADPIDWVYGKPAPAYAGVRYFGYEKTSTDGKRMMFTGYGPQLLEETTFHSIFPKVK
jgi:hypothetical protein